MSPEDEATAHLLVTAAFHDAAARADEQGDPSIGDFSRAVLRQFEEHQHLEGALYAVVMRYAQEHASPEDVAALRRWMGEVTGS
ncbi:hypothetical protein [Streptomyces lavendofoliae]|uniref:Uncharacterized protein n=1 Tax=Streptomyces lavendofoliae TaxID=67314 RepID=A0A918M7H6_9ACTN|nr:hypothetical protein [Streptomyces lavendofoliae]GGU61873.1 hypothetical protein GCM10010274_58300 [Streptomyces lavendofoliae]